MFVVIKNSKEEQAILEVLEKAGFKWRSGQKPTEFKMIIPEYNEHDSYNLFILDDKKLAFGSLSFGSSGHKPISVNKLVEKFVKLNSDINAGGLNEK